MSDKVRWSYKSIADEQKSGQGDEAADSTDSTKPIHLVLQHLRESFSFLFIRYIVLKHRHKPDIVRSC
ncbi:TPA: hypothetical protein ACFOFZ_002038, partial [Neisseria meningitidis]